MNAAERAADKAMQKLMAADALHRAELINLHDCEVRLANFTVGYARPISKESTDLHEYLVTEREKAAAEVLIKKKALDKKRKKYDTAVDALDKCFYHGDDAVAKAKPIALTTPLANYASWEASPHTNAATVAMIQKLSAVDVTDPMVLELVRLYNETLGFTSDGSGGWGTTVATETTVNIF